MENIIRKFDIEREKAKKEYEETLKDIEHWESFCGLLKEHRDKNDELFSIRLKHIKDIFCDKQPDDEVKVEAYAKEFGYKVVDEIFNEHDSVFVFKKK